MSAWQTFTINFIHNPHQNALFWIDSLQNRKIKKILSCVLFITLLFLCFTYSSKDKTNQAGACCSYQIIVSQLAS